MFVCSDFIIKIRGLKTNQFVEVFGHLAMVYCLSPLNDKKIMNWLNARLLLRPYRTLKQKGSTFFLPTLSPPMNQRFF